MIFSFLKLHLVKNKSVEKVVKVLKKKFNRRRLFRAS